MRLLLRLVRVAALGILAALVLWIRPTTIHAQYGGQCCDFYTVTDACASCCQAHNYVDNEIFTCSGFGYFSIDYQDLNCGGNRAGQTCYSNCNAQWIPVPAYDPSCYGGGGGGCPSGECDCGDGSCGTDCRA